MIFIGIGIETCASSLSIDGVMAMNVIQASMTKPKRMLPALFVDFRRPGGAYGGKFVDEGRGNTVEYDWEHSFGGGERRRSGRFIA